MMRFDMHCHTKYGSIDAKVPIADYVSILKEKNYDGMLVTDHDSYRGYNTWMESGLNDDTDFIVLRGVEYDTRDAGHFIVILPDGIHLKALSVRGMSVRSLVKLVHRYGGVTGPAHPFGVRCSSAMFFGSMKKDRDLIHEFDFVEGFNTCESDEANELSQILASEYALPTVGGSDSHDRKYVGMGYTDIDADIKCNNDLISAIRSRNGIHCGGIVRGKTFKSGQAHAFYSVLAFMAYNAGLGLIFSPYRAFKIRKAYSISDISDK